MALNLRRLSLILAACSAGLAHAQDGGLPDWVEADPFASGADDPIGVDRQDRLERVTPTRPEEEVAPRVPVQHGEVVSAIAGVREEQHDVRVRLVHGLAVVETELRFTSSARYAAEVRYRLAVPPGASLASLRVCNSRGCRDGLVDPSAGTLGPYDDAARSRSHDPSPLPIAHAAVIRDARGDAVWLRAAPVQREGRPLGRGLARTPPGDGPLTVQVRYAFAAPVHGGRVRWILPARGHDDRAAPARILVRSDELRAGAVDNADAVEESVERAASEPAEITALASGGQPIAQLWRIGCGDRSCVRLRIAAPPRPPVARDVFLVLDASPSTSDGARGRIVPALATLLGALPRGTRVRVAVFAARAEAIVGQPVAPEDVPLDRIARALEENHGSATRFEAAWSLVRGWTAEARSPLLILIGDGGLTAGDDARTALREAERAGLAIASMNVADRTSTPELRQAFAAVSATIVDAGPQADRAARGLGLDALEEHIASILAPVTIARVQLRAGSERVTLGTLRAGEEIAWEGEVRGRATLGGLRTVAAPVGNELSLVLADRIGRANAQRAIRLAALAPTTDRSDRVCRTQGAFRDPSAPVTTAETLVLADARECDRTAVPERPRAERPLAPPSGGTRLREHRGPRVLPSRSLRDMLRQRLVPVARRCFRDDRAGRANYAQRAVFEFRLADREVIEANVTGPIDPRLRQCLIAAVDSLDVPTFDGSAVVRYPLYTVATQPSPTIALESETAELVDAVADEQPAPTVR